MPLDQTLTPIEARVLGSLIEKELTTPDYYPLSLNALTLACNQKTNRDPVMELSDNDVQITLDSLRSKQLAWQRSIPGSRVLKFEHNLNHRWTFGPDEVAALCVLLLRGAQTTGEIRIRTERMHAFSSIAEVEATLQKLSSREDGPFVCMLPRAPGTKENRYVHLFCGQPEAGAIQAVYEDRPPAVRGGGTSVDRITALETQVSALAEKIEKLAAEFAEFRKQFE